MRDASGSGVALSGTGRLSLCRSSAGRPVANPFRRRDTRACSSRAPSRRTRARPASCSGRGAGRCRSSRGVTASPSSTTAMRGSSALTVSRGMTATPTPAATSALHGRVVVRAERPVRLEPLGAERRFDRLDRGALAEADERLVDDVAAATARRRRAASPRRTISTYGSRSSSTVSSGCVADRQQHEADVDLAALDGDGDLVVLELVERHVDLAATAR